MHSFREVRVKRGKGSKASSSVCTIELHIIITTTIIIVIIIVSSSVSRHRDSSSRWSSYHTRCQSSASSPSYELRLCYSWIRKQTIRVISSIISVFYWRRVWCPGWEHHWKVTHMYRCWLYVFLFFFLFLWVLCILTCRLLKPDFVTIISIYELNECQICLSMKKKKKKKKKRIPGTPKELQVLRLTQWLSDSVKWSTPCGMNAHIKV